MTKHPSSIRGFTLVELMVVIVIMAILASLVMMNIGGVDQRKAMQAREIFLMDMKRIQRESTDQARILALNVQNATDVSPFRYSVVEYSVAGLHQQKPVMDQNKKWQEWADFKPKQLPENVGFTVQTQDYQFENAANSELTGQNAPVLIWFGNGEVKPVWVQFYFEQNPVGEVIEIDHLGKIHEN